MKISGIHYSQAHWAVKKGKRQGRPIGDASAVEEGECALNSEFARELAAEAWGTIEHPAVLQVADTGWEDTALWKMDLKGAFSHALVRRPDRRAAACFPAH